MVLYGLSDPRLGFVTVTKVKVSPDLQHAKVFVSVLGDQAERDTTMSVLENAARVIQRAVGPRLKTRTIPMISFEFDHSIEGSIRVSELIREARATDADAMSAEHPAQADDAIDEHQSAPAGEAGGDGGGDGNATV
jgi:ribosome-binding factor A